MTKILSNLIYDLGITRKALDDVRQELSLLRTRSLMQPERYPATMRQGLADRERHLEKQERRIEQQIREIESQDAAGNVTNVI